MVFATFLYFFRPSHLYPIIPKDFAGNEQKSKRMHQKCDGPSDRIRYVNRSHTVVLRHLKNCRNPQKPQSAGTNQ